MSQMVDRAWAEAFCSSTNMHLAGLLSLAQADAVNSAVKDRIGTSSYWIGAREFQL